LEQLNNYKEWHQIKTNWKNVDKVKAEDWYAREKIIAEKRKETKLLFNKLVKAGLFTKEGAKTFIDIYCDRIYHYLRLNVATCYVTVSEARWKQASEER